MLLQTRRHWIPPIALATGQIAHGASWIALFALAAAPDTSPFRALAWLHLVVLGWLTLTALAVLVHVIPAFTDAEWRGNGIARAALFPYAAGVIALVVAFWLPAPALFGWAAGTIALALTAYLVPAVLTLARAFRGQRTEAAIARALTITLTALAITAALGVALALALGGRAPAGLLNRVPPIHAAFGLVGWLTILIMGVSARTIGPISGSRSRLKALHIIAGSGELIGVLIITSGFLIGGNALVVAGIGVVLAGAIAYAVDVTIVLGRASVEHRPPQAFFAAGVCWLLLALVLFIGTQCGLAWGRAAIYVMIAGWIGQLVNAHIYHIGVRLVATIVRGDDDETRPGELLTPGLSWAGFACMQFAIAAGGIALLAAAPLLLEAAAVAGFVGWLTIVANVATAVRRARRPKPPEPAGAVISLLG